MINEPCKECSPRCGKTDAECKRETDYRLLYGRYAPLEPDMDHAEHRLLETCERLNEQLQRTMREVRRANEVLPEVKRQIQNGEI